jgi:multisubunit Na+/H+ antiporter MnhB subunit
MWFYVILSLLVAVVVCMLLGFRQMLAFHFGKHGYLENNLELGGGFHKRNNYG